MGGYERRRAGQLVAVALMVLLVSPLALTWGEGVDGSGGDQGSATGTIDTGGGSDRSASPSSGSRTDGGSGNSSGGGDGGVNGSAADGEPILLRNPEASKEEVEEGKEVTFTVIYKNVLGIEADYVAVSIVGPLPMEDGNDTSLDVSLEADNEENVKVGRPYKGKVRLEERGEYSVHFFSRTWKTTPRTPATPP